MWKKNILEDLKAELLGYEIVEEFSADIKKKFGEGDKETVKVTKLKKLEQRGKIMKKFVQEFKRVAKGSEYEGKSLIKEFKKGINRTIY